jgi:DNA repair and recombination protein RAD54B
MGLASSVVDGKKNEASFSMAELRDLFRLDLDSLCQTHELLKCSCNGNGQLMAAISDGIGAETRDSEGADDEDDDLPLIPRLIRASQLDMVAQEAKLEVAAERKKRLQKMQALMEYRHIDTSLLSVDDGGADLEATIDDEVLVKVLKEEGNRVDYVFAKGG